MKVYHGTSLSRWEKIKKTGLIPRGKSGKSNWTHSIESNPETIYFSDAYAMFFALQSVDTGNLEKDHAVVIEIETDLLEPSRLVPDEDVLEQVGRMQKGGDGLPSHWDMKKRTRHYRGLTLEYAQQGLDFEWSMQVMGTGGFMGAVMPEAFTRVAIIDIAKQAELAMTYLDSQVSVQNYRFLGSRYRALTKMIFGDEPDPVDELGSVMGFPTIDLEGLEVVQLTAQESV